MPEVAGKIIARLRHPLRTFRAVMVRAEMGWLLMRNRFNRSPVNSGDPGVVVSLTTYGKRAGAVHLAIESIARGTIKPSRLILWLDEAGLYTNLPRPLRRLERRGLEIRLCKNYGPHKKYFPFLTSQRTFNHPLATADDDVIYPRNWLAGLLEAHARFPHSVNCYRARTMTLREGRIAPYREWPLCQSAEPGFRTVATGVSGVIYPAELLKELKRAGTGFEERCPRADDLWLHVLAIRSGFKIRQMQTEALHFPHIPGTQAESLYAENCAQDDGNDRQLAVTYESSDLELLHGSPVEAHA